MQSKEGGTMLDESFWILESARNILELVLTGDQKDIHSQVGSPGWC
jgi:hypothetical protein